MQQHSKRQWVICLLVLAGTIAILLPEQASAALNSNNILDTILDKYNDVASSWAGTMIGYARTLFLSLALISLAWLGAQLVLGNTDMSQFMTEFVKWVMFIGFGLALLSHATTWFPDIVNSFRQAASTASGLPNGVEPSDVFELGIDISKEVREKWDNWNIGQGIIIGISSLIILVCYALIAAWMLIALIEMYIVLNAGVLLLGFGGSYWTKEVSFKYMLYTISIGAKLMTIILLVGLGKKLVEDWQANFTGNYEEAFILAGASIVLLAVIKEIPSYVQALVSGASLSTAGSVMSSGASTASGMRSGIAATAGGAALAAGGSSAIREATKMAGEEGKTGMAKIMSGVATGATAIAKSAGKEMTKGYGSLFARTAATGVGAAEMVRKERANRAQQRSQSDPSRGSISPAGSPAKAAASEAGQGTGKSKSGKDTGRPNNRTIV